MKSQLMGEIREDMVVIALDNNYYKGLEGVITEIRGENEKETENEGELEIIVNFNDNGELDKTHPQLNGTSVEQVIMNEDELGMMFDSQSFFTIDGFIVCKDCLIVNKEIVTSKSSDDKLTVTCCSCEKVMAEDIEHISEFVVPIKPLKEFILPVIWQESGTMKVIASSLEEAERIAIEGGDMPGDAEYLCDSMVLDKDGIDYGRYYDVVNEKVDYSDMR